MRRTVIGIHGLGNKAPKKVLRSWWKISIQEGFKHYGFPPRNFRFHMVYWAGLLHTEPLDARERDRSSGRYIPSPYHPIDAPINKKPSRFRKRFLDELERLLDAVVFTDKSFINFEIIADRIIQRLFSDLEVYYYKRCLDRNGNSRPAKEVIRDELAEALRKNRRRKILLIAHSMGSIIAYDVLCRADSGIRVDTFVTIGSPLGWPFIMKKHGKEHPGSGRARSLPKTPEAIQKAWYNLSDLDDSVALNYDIAGDYGKNSRGIRPEDSIIYNTYLHRGKRDTHSSVGYLRTPEMSRIIQDFLGKPRFEVLRETLRRLTQSFPRLRVSL
jgi:hypothetical protein